MDLNKGLSSRFRVGSRVKHETPEEGWRTYRPKRCEYYNGDEDISPNILNDKKTICIFLSNAFVTKLKLLFYWFLKILILLIFEILSY